MNKQTFYRLDSKGKVRVWEISVEKVNENLSNIIVLSGLEDGKKITTVTPITEGKNIGKVNETTVFQQAISDAETEIDKKIKREGYVSDRNNMKAKGETATIKVPMKGETYHPTGLFVDGSLRKGTLTLEKAKLRRKRVGIQRKFDGYRYRIHVDRNGVTFYSSGGDVVPPFPHISDSVQNSFLKIADYVERKYGITEYYLDGEIYRHSKQIVNGVEVDDPFGGFQNVASACGTKVHMTPEKLELRANMQFHLFDVCLQAPYTTRLKVLEYFYNSDIVVPVETIYIDANEEEIDALMATFLKEGYEGLMIRQLDMPYEFKRSKQLFKYKPIIDAEYKVIGFNKSITGETLGSIICAMDTNFIVDPSDLQFTKLKDFQQKYGEKNVFAANPMNDFGTDKMRQEIWDNKEKYLGKFVTCVFLNYTDDNLPRHPRVKGFRKGKSKD